MLSPRRPQWLRGQPAGPRRRACDIVQHLRPTVWWRARLGSWYKGNMQNISLGLTHPHTLMCGTALSTIVIFVTKKVQRRTLASGTYPNAPLHSQRCPRSLSTMLSLIEDARITHAHLARAPAARACPSRRCCGGRAWRDEARCKRANQPCAEQMVGSCAHAAFCGRREREEYRFPSVVAGGTVFPRYIWIRLNTCIALRYVFRAYPNVPHVSSTQVTYSDVFSMYL